MKIIIKKQLLIVLLLFFVIGLILSFQQNTAKADSLSDNIDEQLSNIDLTELETFYNQIMTDIDDSNFFVEIKKLLNGEYKTDYKTFFDYSIKLIFSDVKNFLPTFVSVVVISILCGIIQNVKGTFISESVSEITFFACILSIILLLVSLFIQLLSKAQITIKTMAKLNDIMSPIILTLMLAVGGNASASIYKPVVGFLSNGIINIFFVVVLPLITLITAFNIVSNFSNVIKLNKFSDFFSSLIKWIIGITVTIFSIFLSVQGITSAHFDGISIKAAKYAISNSIPIVGGFIKDGFDLVLAGSVLIKNSIGIASISLLIFITISPLISLMVFSFLLKLSASLIETVSDNRISNFCLSLDKTVSYLIATILIVALMMFITVILMIFSANAFI